MTWAQIFFLALFIGALGPSMSRGWNALERIATALEAMLELAKKGGKDNGNRG